MASHSSSTLRLSLAIVLALLLALAAAGGRPASAADLTVDSTADAVDATPGDGVCADAGGNCTLRAAIQEANALAGPDTITLPADVNPYTLTIVGTGEDAAANGDLDITDDVSITGAGPASTIIDGNGGVTGERVFDVDPGSAGITADISDVTVRNGSDGSAAGILNRGTLTLTDSTVSGNTATVSDGGGIYSKDTVILTNVTVSGNTAAAGGGGIWNWGTATLTDSTVSGNAAATGGGIYSNGGTLTLDYVTVSGNTASGGGGIVNVDGTVDLTDSTVSGNTASGGGGGIWNRGTLTLTNSTVSDNEATILSSGGGIINDDGRTVTLTNVTIAGNTATGNGGGIWNNGGIATLTNTIVANSTSGGDCAGTALTSNGNNLDSDGTCGLAAAGDLPSTDPQLGSLADNGGPTQTHALLANSPSPAIDAGDNTGCPATDQRGVARPIDGDVDGTATCDIGAYEYHPPPTPTPTPTPTATPTATPTGTPPPTRAVLGEAQAEPIELPSGGGEPPPGSSGTLAIVLLAAAALGLMGAGSALMGMSQRR